MNNEDAEQLALLRTEIASLPVEELRLALVLNGGVSLAVWMGGVALEIDRLSRSSATLNTAYGALLKATRTEVGVDVISGTSAGGITGAALALSQSNVRADLRALRTLWAEQGRMEELLRKPFRGQPTSMLRGDDYFLPELQRAMRLLAFPFEPRATRPAIDLTLTTTLLTGAQDVTVDDFGERIPERIHAGNFRFTNIGPEALVPQTEDLFGQHRIESTAEALALAARCTASFPFAFEPSFVPVNEPSGSLADSRPDMAEFASWTDPGDGACHSRYAVDGGLLANTPLNHALEAIARRQVSGPVRRAMLMVFPHAPQAMEVPPDLASEPPGAAAAVGGVLGALLAQGSRSFVERVDDHNRTVAEWQGSREQVLDGMGEADPVAALYAMLGVAWPHYRHVRIRHAARGLADKVAAQEQWSYDRIRQAAEGAQRAWVATGPGQPALALPYVPATFAWTEGEWQAALLRDPTTTAPTSWDWGDSAAIGVVDAVASVLRTALSVAPEAHRDALGAARLVVDQAAATIRAERQGIDAIWTTNEFLRTLPPTSRYWRARIVAYGRAMQGAQTPDDQHELGQLLAPVPQDEGLAASRLEAITTITSWSGASGAAMAQAVGLALSQVTELSDELRELALTPAGANAVSGLQRWCDFLFAARQPQEPVPMTTRLLLRLLALDCGTRLLSDGAPTGANTPVRLAELSLRVSHPWTRFSTTPADKAAGLELARFGGFLKRSWRMNDWTWGRLDAVTMLCQTVLDPQRIARMAAMLPVQPDAQQLLRLLETDLYGTVALPESQTQLRQGALEDLEAALAPGQDLRHLPRLARWAALPLQAEIMLEELPVVAAAIKIDGEEGAGTPTRGTRFLLDHSDLLAGIPGVGALPDGVVTTQQRFDAGREALLAFDAAGIGRERLGEEKGSDALIRTVSSAAGVLATVIDADMARTAPAVRPVTSVVRGALLLPYWIINGLAGSGTIGRFIATIGLVLGGLVLTLSLLGVLGGFGSAGALFGTATVAAALAYSALKTGSTVHACALLAPVGPLLFFALETAAEAGESTSREAAGGDAASRVLVLVVAIGALYVLANLPWPLASPMVVVASRLVRVWPWIRAHAKILAMTVLLVGLAVLTWWSVQPGEPLADLWQAFSSATWHVGVAFTLVALAGGLVAYRQGRMLRAWRPRGLHEPTSGRPANAPTAPPAGASTAPDVTYDPPQAASGWFVREHVQHPAGVAASWAPAYGALYLLVALALLGSEWVKDDDTWWQDASFWWFSVLGLLLCVAAPLVIGLRARQRLHRALQRAWPPVFPTHDVAEEWQPGDDEQLLIFMLLKYDKPHCYLLRADRAHRAMDDGPFGRHRMWSTQLRLTRRGRDLLERLSG